MTLLGIAKELISKPSITPSDAGCQEFIARYLKDLGFSVTSYPINQVTNLWATHGSGGPLWVFAGHTDVVPPGDLSQWNTPPFEPTVIGDALYGRGAADMKGAIAAMLFATQQWITQYPNHPGTVAFLITSDEEGAGIDGTRAVMEILTQQSIVIDYCLIGEASSNEALGDMLKVGRRGSLQGHLTLLGKQGHIAYPQLAINPILSALTNHTWDEGNAFFDPTCLQFSNIQSGTGTTNVIPQKLSCQFNFRYGNNTAEALIKQVTEILESFQFPYHLDWTHSGPPFLSKPGKLVQACQNSIQTLLNRSPLLSTTGGTSDGRFIAPFGAEVVELGVCNKTIHAINECCSVQELNQLSRIYESILTEMLL